MIRRLLALLLFFILGTGVALAAELTPPVADGPVQVSVLMYILDLTNVDSGQQNFTANVYLEYHWTDPRLAHEGDGPVIRGMNEIWQPNLQVLNQQDLKSTFPDQLEVYPDGAVLYRQRVWGSFTQPMDLREYPRDSQRLTIQLVAAGLSPDQIELVPSSEIAGAFATELAVPDFTITGSEMVAEPYSAAGSSRSAAAIRSTYFANRKTGYFLVKVILPLILIVMMSWSVFWIDPSLSNPQISVATTTMLTLIAYRFAVGASLPTISYLTRLDKFIMASTVLVFLTLAQAVLTSRLNATDHRERALWCDRWSRLVFPAAFVAVLIVTLM